ncbi:MAG: lysine--tRNA ligase [Candidatus Moranbacteria bacterium RIFCSPHIGHO2_01_FULL_55_24]|nr:MAG: lysine--tRNA ligase [Candidatus Moranbacteria bacterium RIFCSPHIGHO2_01_FULL_55_24]
MFWGDKLVEQIKEQYKEKIARGEAIVIRDEKTASGRVHVGSMRGVAIHGIVAEILQEEGVSCRYLYEINDFDPMDGLPVYLDESVFREHMGKPLCNVPSPDPSAKNFAEYFGNEFKSVIADAGFVPEFYLSSEVYRAGRYNEVIRLALENASKIREIYKRISGAVKPDDWMPLQVICEKCGKIGTTKVKAFDGEMVEYACQPNLVKWAEGCGHEGKISPFDGNAKLPWKVEWAAKFRVMGVDVEGAGKDHSTKGGARDIANHISREVFDYQPPFDIPYEFFLVGGKKMSSSKGAGSSSREVADFLPPQLFRFLLISKDPKRVIDFIPDGDTIPLLYDLYDKYAESYFADKDDDYTRTFALAHPVEKRGAIQKRFLPRFSLVSFLVQMPHMDFLKEVEALKGSTLTEADIHEAEERATYAKAWLGQYAPESYRYELQQESVPEGALHFTPEQKEALNLLLEYVRKQESLDGQELHTALHSIKEKTGIPPKDLFSAIYLSFLGKESGPKAGWFLSVLEKSFLESRLQAVVK